MIRCWSWTTMCSVATDQPIERPSVRRYGRPVGRARLAPFVCGVNPIAAAPRRDHHQIVVRVLIVDDGALFGAAAAELLVGCGVEPSGFAADADAAIAFVTDTCPDGILLDI